MDKKIIAIISTVLIIMAVIVSDLSFHLGIVSFIGNIFSPVEIVLGDAASSVSSFFGNFGHIANLEKENNQLKKELDQATVDIANLSQEKVDNESLRKDLALKQSSNLDLVTGEITSFDPSLNNGLNVKFADIKGINKGDMAIADGFMIGKVDNINGNIVRITLLTDVTSAIPAKIQGKEIPGVADGQIGNGLRLDQVPQGEIVSDGDIVVTSGLGGNLPAGIPFAKVGSVQKVAGSIFQQIDLDPLVDVLGIHYVMIAR
jgi:rod shape-determining protein MreC